MDTQAASEIIYFDDGRPTDNRPAPPAILFHVVLPPIRLTRVFALFRLIAAEIYFAALYSGHAAQIEFAYG